MGGAKAGVQGRDGALSKAFGAGDLDTRFHGGGKTAHPQPLTTIACSFDIPEVSFGFSRRLRAVEAGNDGMSCGIGCKRKTGGEFGPEAPWLLRIKICFCSSGFSAGSGVTP